MKKLLISFLVLGSFASFAQENKSIQICEELDELLGEYSSIELNASQSQILQKIQQIWATTCIEQQQQDQ